MGVAARQPAASSQWRNRSEVLFGIVKAGRVARRNSLHADTGIGGLSIGIIKRAVGQNTPPWQAMHRRPGPYPFLIQQLPHPGVKCRQASGTRRTGGRTGGIPSETGPAPVSDGRDAGENANPTGVVRGT